MPCYLVVDLETSQSWGCKYGFQVGSKHTSSIRLDCQGTKGVEPSTNPHHDLNHTAGFFLFVCFFGLFLLMQTKQVTDVQQGLKQRASKKVIMCLKINIGLGEQIIKVIKVLKKKKSNKI